MTNRTLLTNFLNNVGITDTYVNNWAKNHTGNISEWIDRTDPLRYIIELPDFETLPGGDDRWFDIHEQWLLYYNQRKALKRKNVVKKKIKRK